MTTARIENGPSQFQFVLALHDDKMVAFTIVFADGKRMTVQAELWSFAKFGRNGYHNGRCKIGGIMQGEEPIPSQACSCWATFAGDYDQRSRTGEIEVGGHQHDAFAPYTGR